MNTMKTFPFLLIMFLLSGVLFSCQREYYEEVGDVPTETIDFISLTASKDSAYMFDSITIHAKAEGENLEYKWRKNKGSMVYVPGDKSSVYFWGCPTCTGWTTVSCTVENEYGSYTKEIKLYIIPEYKK